MASRKRMRDDYAYRFLISDYYTNRAGNTMKDKQLKQNYDFALKTKKMSDLIGASNPPQDIVQFR